jgi:selenide,water dikinase
MQRPSQTIKKDLVLIGGGHAHVSVIKQFGMRPFSGVRLTVISRDLLAPYSGMLPGYVAGHYSLDQCHIDLTLLTKFAGGRFIHASVNGLDVDKQQILCEHRAPIDYDVVSINIGSAPDMSRLGQVQSTVVPVKPISHFVNHWRKLRQRVLAHQGELHIAVVGAGAGGVELTLAMQHRLQKELQQQQKTDLQLRFYLFDANSEVLSSHNRKVRAYFQDLLLRRDIELHLHQRITEFKDGRLTTETGQQLHMDEVLWVTRASAQSWLRETALALSPEGFISVDPTLQSVSHPNVFAVGDIAHVIAHPRPKAGVFAVRQGPPLARNLSRVLKNKTLYPFKPQSEFLSLISTGDKQAVASRAQWMFSGKLMWIWKDWIDRRFMNRFNRLPEINGHSIANFNSHNYDLSEQSLFNGPPRYCGGCGSKVSQTVLQQTLASLSIKTRADVICGLRDPDDAAVVKVENDQYQVHTVDHFRAFIDDPFLFGKITAEHALNDLYAMGAQAKTAMAIATLERQGEKLQAQELRQLLSGAIDALDHAGAILIGGHSNCGDDTALGLALTGTVQPGKVLHRTGLNPGDKLILNKALGTGALFAAYMRNKTAGIWIDKALNSMQLSNRDAANILQQHCASACTDVSGFGLLGHLQEMIGTDNLKVTVTLSQLPILMGAHDVVQNGIVSSAYAQNRTAENILDQTDTLNATPNYPFLFDPQTSGGLLAGIPAEQATACLQELWQRGYSDAKIIGEVQASSETQAMVYLIN